MQTYKILTFRVNVMIMYTHSNLILKECNTISGPSSNVPCDFPFTYKNVTYDECVPIMDGVWCSTEVDDDGYYISGKWGYCHPECPILLPGKLTNVYIHIHMYIHF